MLGAWVKAAGSVAVAVTARVRLGVRFAAPSTRARTRRDLREAVREPLYIRSRAVIEPLESR